MSKTLLLDADSFCYSFGAVHQMVMKWTPELYTYKGDFSGAKVAMDSFIESTMEATGSSEIRVALSDTKANFRNRVMARYKMNRINKDKPILFRALREYLMAQYSAEVWPGLEGDDLVSMWATEPGMDGVVCSIDKDCQQIPGTLYNPNTKKMEVITAYDAEIFFLSQVLTGDLVDGYKGCPDVGPKRAKQWFGRAVGVADVWDMAVIPAYEKAGLSEAVALENARCARLLRHGDYRYETGAIRLWDPRGADVWLEMP